MKVPMLDLRAQYATVGPAVRASVERVLASGHYILGEDVGGLEREIAARAGVSAGASVRPARWRRAAARDRPPDHRRRGAGARRRRRRQAGRGLHLELLSVEEPGGGR